jgi:lambda family phage portal protein
LEFVTEDSAIWQSSYALTSRCRDLFRANPIYQKYREGLWANVFGSDGTMLRMKITETEARVVHAPDEKAHLWRHEHRINRVREWASKQTGNELQKYNAFKLADALAERSLDSVIRGIAMIEIGNPDVFANFTVEKAWKEFQRAEYCDIRQTRSYNTMRQLRLISAVRDGDFFIRMIKIPKINKFGFTMQMINAEWCDRYFNTVLPNGNVVIMGIEYQMTEWGLGPIVAFYFIKRQPMDWQFSVPGAFNFSSGNLHIRISADEIIHYARPVDADSTRPAPWICASIPQARQLNMYEIYEVIAARKEACTTGFLYSDINPEGGENTQPIDPRKGIPKLPIDATNWLMGLPWGVKYQANNPTHPSMNYPGFRKGQGQSIASALPGGDYNTLFSDLENINFSAGRLGRLDKNETVNLLQIFDQEKAENPIFESFLEMGLITGAIPLPFAKFNKFNKKVFQGPRAPDVDEVKAENASAMRVANKRSSRQRETAMIGNDWEEIVFELAEENMILTELGMTTETTAESVKPPMPLTDEDDPETAAKPDAGKTPAKTNGNGKHLTLPAGRM